MSMSSAIDEAWQDFFNWYCRHGYYRGIECPDCDSSSPVASFDTNRDPGDETDFGQ